MNYGSVCSGIEAATVAWHGLGWQPAWLAEIEQFPSAVLAHHYPNVENLGDMTLIRDRIKTGEVLAPDILVGGTPCQAFSVAGSRKSLDDDRGQLTLEYVRLANEIDTARLISGQQPAIIVWENVPGVLNTKDNAFGCFLGALSGEDGELQPAGKKWANAGCVFGPQRSVAWRILDAQYFGVAQRRRRVFVVASARKDINPVEVLFEFDGVRRDIAPSRNTREETTGSTAQGFAESSFAQFRPTDSDAGTLKRSGGVLGGGSETFVVVSTISNSGQDNAVFCGTQNDACRDVGREVAPTLRAGNGGGAVNQVVNVTHSIQGNMIGRSLTAGPAGSGISDDISFTLTKGDRHGVAHCLADHPTPKHTSSLCFTLNRSDFKGAPCESVIGLVFRLTPKECERLQGFPDDYTKIPYRNKAAEDCPDGPRYAACGNSMAVPVMRWIGERIQKYCEVMI